MILEQSKIFFNDTLAAGASQATVIDLAKLASSMNRKHIPSVDRQGNAQVYMCAVQVKYGTDVLTSIKTAPNLYTTKAAVKAWHDARVKMITRTGANMSDLGPYARHLRPFLDVNHENGTTTEADTATSTAGGYALNTHFQGDEYTRTRLAVTTPQENTQGSGGAFKDLVDTYSLTLCDASVNEVTTDDDPDESGQYTDQDSFISVGMIAEWLTSINLKRGGLGDGVRVQADNALLQLIADSASSEEALEIIEDSAEEGRPWDLDGSAYTSLTGQTIFRSGQHRSDKEIIFVPCGLLELTQVNGHSGSELVVTEIEILDVYDMWSYGYRRRNHQVGSQDNNHLFDYCCRHLSDTNRGGIIPAPLVAAAVVGGAGSIALEFALNKISGRKTTEQDVVTAGLIGVIPGVGIAKGLGNVGRRLLSGRRILSKYKAGVTQHSISAGASAKGFGYAITSKISEAQARRNMYIYAAIGGIPAVKGAINAMVIEKSIDVIYNNKKSPPATETQRKKPSRNVGSRKARNKTSRKKRMRVAKTLPRRGGRCPNGYRYSSKLNACVRK